MAACYQDLERTHKGRAQIGRPTKAGLHQLVRAGGTGAVFVALTTDSVENMSSTPRMLSRVEAPRRCSESGKERIQSLATRNIRFVNSSVDVAMMIDALW